MIVCLCHRVSDRDIRRSVAEGVHNFDVLQDDTKVAAACGSCHDCAREVFDEALQACAAAHGASCGGPSRVIPIARMIEAA
ncbi:(2Fe-2S)-binding protein [Roseateles amylovorans]|uniref:Bacterioferritin-associated ferredoxin n=1 Tax=Roseateles amylovorans TaxID=2978473 RepID=A0ABY6AZ31_9BURK|nr:(2Fe-2S)-binding protein [Roseateles amylovorans]UXH77548.1 (2Fe-2S)-binding protein [Roseateles amylovorans]